MRVLIQASLLAPTSAINTALVSLSLTSEGVYEQRDIFQCLVRTSTDNHHTTKATLRSHLVLFVHTSAALQKHDACA